jgi:hypothetical protein
MVFHTTQNESSPGQQIDGGNRSRKQPAGLSAHVVIRLKNITDNNFLISIALETKIICNNQ